MKIGTKYKLESDSLNIVLYEKYKVKTGKHTGETGWKPLGYFGTPQNALKFLADHKLKESGMKDMEQIVKTQQKIYDLIDSLKLS